MTTARRWSIAAMASGLLLSAGCTAASSATATSSTVPSISTVTSTRAPMAATSVGSTVSASTVSTSTVAPSTSAAPTSTASSTSTARPVTATVTRTRPGATITVTVAPPKATPEAPPVAGECPYLSADVVSDITGQHHGPTQLIAVEPHPMCVFYRSDGGRMGSVRVIQAASAAAATAAVNQHVPIAGSQPATQPAGWTGGSSTSPGQMTQDSQASSVYAVSKGTVAIVVEEDESPSLKARVMAVCAIHGLGLAPGPAPDYCLGAEQ